MVDRYTGVYSGGRYTAWYCDPWDVPSDVEESDPLCALFWDNYDGPVGRGDTIQGAIDDLVVSLENYKKKYDTRRSKTSEGTVHT